MTRDPVKLLFGRYRRRLLGLLLLRPDEAFHVRELSRLTEIPVGSVDRELKRLTEADLLVRRPVGNQVQYQANRDCPVFDELAALFRKTTGLAGVLREALLSVSGVEIALVFGSMASGNARPGSDVDLLVLGSADFASVVEALLDVHEVLGREINPVVMPIETFVRKLNEGDRFVRSVLEGDKVYIKGNQNHIEELVEGRKA